MWMQFKDIITQTATTVLRLKTESTKTGLMKITISVALQTKNKAYTD